MNHDDLLTEKTNSSLGGLVPLCHILHLVSPAYSDSTGHISAETQVRLTNLGETSKHHFSFSLLSFSVAEVC